MRINKLYTLFLLISAISPLSAEESDLFEITTQDEREVLERIDSASSIGGYIGTPLLVDDDLLLLEEVASRPLPIEEEEENLLSQITRDQVELKREQEVIAPIQEVTAPLPLGKSITPNMLKNLPLTHGILISLSVAASTLWVYSLLAIWRKKRGAKEACEPQMPQKEQMHLPWMVNFFFLFTSLSAIFTIASWPLPSETRVANNPLQPIHLHLNESGKCHLMSAKGDYLLAANEEIGPEFEKILLEEGEKNEILLHIDGRAKWKSVVELVQLAQDSGYKVTPVYEFLE